MQIDPRQIRGPWKSGYTLAAHTHSAEFIGYNEQGHAQFNTVRSEVGEAVYRLKYQGQQGAAADLAEAACDFLVAKGHSFDAVVPVPPSKIRKVQPVYAITELIAHRLGIQYLQKGLRKTKDTPELKSLTDVEARKAALAEAFSASRGLLQGKIVLLVDDLYRSGASMEAATAAILNEGGAATVYALALTRTRTHR